MVGHWNGERLPRACRDALARQHTTAPFETWVVDNAYSDGSVALLESEYPEVRLLRNGGLLIAAAVFAGIAFGFWLRRKIKLRQVEEVSFEVEALDDMFRGFNLTETYAAQSVAPTADGASKFPV